MGGLSHWGGGKLCIAGGIPACLAAGVSRGYPSMPCRYPDPHPMGKFMGIWLRGVSRFTPKGEVEGNLVRAHMEGGSWGGSGPGPHPRGSWVGSSQRGFLLWGVPASGGFLLWGCLLQGSCLPQGVETPRDGYCCGRYATYWNAFLFYDSFNSVNTTKNWFRENSYKGTNNIVQVF